MKTAIQTLPALAIHGVDPALFDAIDMSGYDEMLTVKDIKKYFHISINAAYNIIHSKGFPAIRIGNSIRVPRCHVYSMAKSAGQLSAIGGTI